MEYSNDDYVRDVKGILEFMYPDEETSMNEWKELKIDKLPEDFLIGGYEVQYKHTARTWTKTNAQPYEIVSFMCRFHIEYRYRTPEPLPPTHRQILSGKYWQMNDKAYWRQVTGVRVKDGKPLYLLFDGWCDAAWFTGRESAICPPEGV